MNVRQWKETNPGLLGGSPLRAITPEATAPNPVPDNRTVYRSILNNGATAGTAVLIYPDGTTSVSALNLAAGASFTVPFIGLLTAGTNGTFMGAE